MITNLLNRSITILKLSEIENELGEITYKYSEYKKIYSKIIPINSRIKDINEENEILVSQYKFIIRKQSLREIDLKMKIKFENQEYNIDYWDLDFKSNEYLEIYTTRIEA